MKKVFFVFLLIFSLLIINGKEYKCETNDNSFQKVERYLLNEYDFEQNGIKLEYTTKSSLNKELERIEDIFKLKDDLVISKGENYISAKSKNINYSVNMYKYNYNLKVEIIILNNNRDILQDDLKNMAEEIQGINFIDERYFLFIKGKINNNSTDAIGLIENSLQLDINECLKINNGYIAKATIYDDIEVNIGQINYDTGSYLIIGTPIIFVTY